MKKIFGIILLSLITLVFSFQVQHAFAKPGNNNNKPIANPLTSPITSPLCKPGWGFGDKNHCHFGPPGLLNK